MAVIEWSLDQGREQYLDLNLMRRIAGLLVACDGSHLVRPDPLTSLQVATGLFTLPPGKPDYTVWRQYARYFRDMLLAAKVGGRMGHLRVTDMCRWLAGGLPGGAPTVDEYLIHLACRFYSPPPSSSSYSPSAPRVFPVCALMRFMWSRIGHVPSSAAYHVTVPLEDIFSFVVGNNCVGHEDVRHYRSLRPTGYAPAQTIRRRTREFLNLVAQMSFVVWEADENRLTCDFSGFAAKPADAVFTPVFATQNADADLEVLSLGSLRGPARPGRPSPSISMPPASLVPMDPVTDVDFSFVEGKRVRITHLRIERNPRLRNVYFQHLAAAGRPLRCDVCGLQATTKYPWVSSDDQLLEIHHLLPLASAVAVGSSGTSLTDLVPLCPTCHRAVHAYYRTALRAARADDFRNKADAVSAYQAAKSQKRP